MEKFYSRAAIAALIVSVFHTVNAQNIAINSSGTGGNSAAILDLSDASNSNLGFAMPNVDLVSMSSANPITSPPEGLIVWNTNNPTVTAGGF
ncbi:MAG TPA: hypothetical protein VK808_10995, partial [Bacteroidia bacterium]|nr:hypothetical protein [Bacteroidia bacterium]